ncbi:MAG: DUF1800 family protein, partial [Chloroflexi bacterium CFX1]|nr:DUF1800 family protein [Chloroflexi bacterium CFX1]
DFLKLTALLSASAALNACAPALRRLTSDPPAVAWSPLSLADFTALNRITFGARVEERARFAEIGLANYIEEQLDYEAINDLTCNLQLSNFKTLNMAANEIEAVANQLFDGYDRRRPINELRQAAFLRQLYSKRQLYEVMVDFWSDHFNIYIEKEPIFYLKTVDDREVIRKHALGNFRDLVWASAHSPAMLTYLDNQANVKGAPNENYARELMELHTLGVNGGYTQNDVMQLARCLTGWSVKKHFWLGEFVFKEDQHEPGEKNVLGLAIQNSRGASSPTTRRGKLSKKPRRYFSQQRATSNRFCESSCSTDLPSRSQNINARSTLRFPLCECSTLKPTASRFITRSCAWGKCISTGRRPTATPTRAKPGRATSCRAGNSRLN